jgi:predicted naringenin-chalcone synthase
MPAYIFSIATAVPKQQYRQEDAARVMLARLGLSKPLAYKIEKIYKQTAIETRHTVLDDPFGEGNSHFFEEDKQPKMGERNKIYKEKALALAVETAKETLGNWQGDPKEITHVISVSCTGLFAPGLEFSLIKELHLSPRVDRLGINFMGCFGAFRGLAIAEALALENPKNRVLLVCTELCSLSFQPSHTLDSLISNALFSDGASSLIVSSQGINPSFRIVSKASFALPDSFEEMQWDASDIGFFMKLSLIPLVIEETV